MDLINILFGSGFIGSSLLSWHVIEQNKKLNLSNRLFSTLQSQLNYLYAPIYHLVSENENTLKLYNKYHEEYDKYFIKIFSFDIFSPTIHLVLISCAVVFKNNNFKSLLLKLNLET